MGMTQMTLNLDFTTELMLYMSLLKLRLKQHFKGNYEFGSFFSGQIDVAKFTLSKGTTNFEVTQFPTVCLSSFWKLRMN